MTAVAGALGSVIGYVGAEVAEASIFERLLWPQRFYNDVSPLSLTFNFFFQPMGGPLHRAALETLDRIRENGLYRGSTRGHMLGTAFFEEKKESYFNRSGKNPKEEKKVRNAFWLEVLGSVDQGRLPASESEGLRHTSKSDLEGHSTPKTQRAVQPFFLLDITLEDSKTIRQSSDFDIREDVTSTGTVIAIIVSELSAVGCAVAAGVWLKVYWLSVFFCIPLTLKLISIPISVRREKVTPNNVTTIPPTIKEKEAMNSTPDRLPAELFEIVSPSLGFILLRGSPTHILPFFRHYGYPIRQTSRDRTREIANILLVYFYVLYFPAGLLSLLWMPANAQYFWLAYQVYAIIAMHASRLFGLGKWGRTEWRVAKALGKGRAVRFCCGRDGEVLRVGLTVEECASYADGRKRVDVVVGHHRNLVLGDL